MANDRKRTPRLGTVFLAALLVATVVSLDHAVADVLVRQDHAALHGRAEKMVRARVAEVRSAWNADHSFIFTYVSLEVLEYYKGSGGDRLEVRVPGGKVGTYRISADSMPVFRVGDEVVVFLRRWDDGALKVAGYAQGLSRVEPSSQGAVLRGGTLDKRLLRAVEREARAGTFPARP